MAIRISPDIAGIVPYSPGKPIEEVERELGITGSIKLASNENPRGPSPKALAVLSEAAKAVNRYPDGGGYYLRDALAERWKVTPDQIILGNGSDEVITLLTKAFLEPGDEAVMADPSFVVYKIDVTAVHAKPVLVPLKDHRHNLPAMAKAVTPKTRLAFICNPNNPTGTYVTTAEVTAFMQAIPPDVLVVFDEAYYEYVTAADYPDTMALLKAGRNVVLLRTFSKIYGLAGLRIGYGLTTPEIVQHLNRIRPPFNTNSLAQKAALAALADEEHVRESRQLNTEGMAYLTERLRALGLTVGPSQANFLYCDVKQDGKVVFEALLRRGVIVRHLGGPFLRVTIGLPHENERFITALQTVLSK
ncbi:MAG TPA: histidinol-phosphate transaminase [Nitrospirales bacterium]|jgi:histidinol-phosphate aminotransferase|nr:histidinol-phosphate transaminase [Nitrospirales bacterium]